MQKGSLYIVATPIGNLQDLSYRAVQVLAMVDLILAEDTRHSRGLLAHYGVNTDLLSCHEHNEAQRVERVVQELEQGRSVALISDAGTPLISDPGFLMVRSLREQGFSVLSVPGCSSIIAALSVSGLPTDSFIFDGFLPAKHAARSRKLADYKQQPRTVVLLESSHRILACVEDLIVQLGEDRVIVIARELTKKFESVYSGRACDVLAALQEDSCHTKGEFVLMIAGQSEQLEAVDYQGVLEILLSELPVKQASRLVAKITGQRKNEVYQRALQLKGDGQ